MTQPNANLLTMQDIMPNDQFLRQRPALLDEMIALKKMRRLFLGPTMSVLFENKRLMWWQVQEMLRVEGGGTDQAVDELAVYNPLIPSRLRLTATLMIEIADPVVRSDTLAALSGLTRHVFLTVGTHRIPAYTVCVDGDCVDDGPVGDQNPTSSVHFLSFVLSDDQRAVFDTQRPCLVCDHPAYRHTQEWPDALWHAVKHDAKDHVGQ